MDLSSHPTGPAGELELLAIRSAAHYAGLSDLLAADHVRRRAVERALVEDREPFHVAGTCHVCARSVAFVVDYEHAPPAQDGQPRLPNWRERLVCPACGLSNRLRSSIHLFRLLCAPGPGDHVYLTEQVTPLYRWMSDHHGTVTGSEHLGDGVPRGEVSPDGIRNEDLTRLSFGAATVDHVLCFDVLEHIYTYDVALAEIARVLRPGGNVMITVPFAATEQNVVRARVRDDGSVEHVLPPEYHGDFVNPEGALCFYHFGWELLDALSVAGFEDPQARFFWSRDLGYLGDGQVFWARTPTRTG